MNEAKMVFECKRIMIADIKGFVVQTAKKLSYKGFEI